MHRFIRQFFVFAIGISLSIQSGAQEKLPGLKQTIDLTIDDLGNADVTVSMKLNAQQWDGYKRGMGGNTASLKRTIEKSMPKYYLTNFKVEEDEMDRTFRLKFKALGLVNINKNEKWEAKLDTKDPDVTKLTERDFLMTSNMYDGGLLIEQTQKIHLPEGAKDGKLEKDSFGKAILTYSTSGGFMARLPLISGIILVIAGLVLFFKKEKPTGSFNTIGEYQATAKPIQNTAPDKLT